MGIRDFPSLAEAEAWLTSEGFQRVPPPGKSWVRDCFFNPASGQGATIGMNMAGEHRAYWWLSDHWSSRQLRHAHETATPSQES